MWWIFAKRSKQFDFSHVYIITVCAVPITCQLYSCFFPPSLHPSAPLFLSQLVEQMLSVEESLGMVQQAEDVSTRLIRIENSKKSSDSESCVCAR